MNLQSDLDLLYKKLFVKMVVGLANRYGSVDIASAEDIVQEAFLAAQQQWRKNPPHNPEAWLFKVCKNIALENVKNHANRNHIEINEIAHDEPFELGDSKIDEGLWMLAACAQPRFSPKQQVIFALRYATGFRVEQIATLLGASPETITKTLQRLRIIVKEEKVVFRPGSSIQSTEALNLQLNVLYLMFCEGYKSSRGKSILNTELCEDALSLTQIIVRDPSLCTPTAKALYALMLFNLSRFEARFTNDGEIIDLETQDRSLWNKEMIALATHYLNEAKTASLSTYHIESVIAYLHCSSKNFATTDWGKIVTLYKQLTTLNESPFVLLNLAIARFYAGNFDEALATMKELGKIAFINHYYLFHVAMGKMLCKSNEYKEALVHFKRAIVLTPHLQEKNYIEKLITQTVIE